MRDGYHEDGCSSDVNQGRLLVHSPGKKATERGQEDEHQHDASCQFDNLGLDNGCGQARSSNARSVKPKIE